MEKFIVKHYVNTKQPIIKGNGFDGLEIGEDRIEAQDFIDFVNKLISEHNLNNVDWVPFWFEGNQAWGYIDSAEKWEEIKEAYKNDPCILKAKNNPAYTEPRFGLYLEYSGGITLNEWGKINKMKL